MVTLSSADKALKSVYLEAISNQLNTTTNPLYNKFATTERDVWGKEIIKLAPYGVNGGIGAGSESGDLPISAENKYEQFKLSLKNLYGTIELSDKAIFASNNNTGAFLSLLDAEMDGLLTASKFNFGRMLYGDGSGTLAKVTSVSGNNVVVDSVMYLLEGMVIDFVHSGSVITNYNSRRITNINRSTKTITISGTAITTGAIVANDIITIQCSYNKELTGLKAIFDTTATTLYGVTKECNDWLRPFNTTMTTISDPKIQEVIDEIECYSGATPDYIVCSYGVRRAYQSYLRTAGSNVDILNLEGGFKAISYNGIPLVADRFCPSGTMFILDSTQFNLHQLCDWRWLEGENGQVLKQVANKPVYSATLVKYADLICNKPSAQAKVTGITEA